MKKTLLTLHLQCPICRSNVTVGTRTVSCSICSVLFPVIHGIPFFSPLAKAPDISLSQTRWDEIYKTEQIHTSSAVNDETVASYVQFLTSYVAEMKKGTLDLGC